jgi:hypothetical protein
VDPTIEGYLNFIRGIMGVPVGALADDSPYIEWSYDWALNLVYEGLQLVASQPTSPTMYVIAVYNCAADMLVNITQDDPNAPAPYNTFWSDLRTKLGINSFVPGVITSSSDSGTSQSLSVPEQLQNLSLMDLQQLKTPWGRNYLAIAGSWGPIWGIS